MSTERPPARPWYDLVMQEAAVRGWSLSELARRAKVGRPTIYGWRDGSDGRIQAGPVNAVADALGISRERALRLAGVIPPAGPEPKSAIPESLLREVMETEGLTDEQRVAVIAAIDNTLAKERGEKGSSARPPAPERHRPAS